MNEIKLISIHNTTFFAKGVVINPGDVFEESEDNAKDLIGRGLAIKFVEEEKKVEAVEAVEEVKTKKKK
jgi:hypothetical protein